MKNILLFYLASSLYGLLKAEEKVIVDKRDFKLTVIILTMDRPNSLRRLMESIYNTDFENDSDFFDVEIHIDKSLGLHYQECIDIAKNFTMPEGRVGKVTPKIFEENHGLRQAWFGAWYPKPDDEFCIIIEDDLEVSPFWYTWLKKSWLKYQDREDIAGIALQRQFLMYKKNEEENENLEIFNNFEPFLYKLVGTWAYSPHPKHWREFLDWFNSIDEYNFDPYVPGMLTSDWLHIHNSMGKRHMTWEQWHVYWCEHHNQYTLYLNLPNSYALVSNWREAGVHNKRSFGRKDYPTLDYCAIELQVFPDKLRKYGWDAMEEIEEDPEFSQFTGSGSQQTGNQQLDPTKPPKPKPGEAGARRFLGGTGTEYSHL